MMETGKPITVSKPRIFAWVVWLACLSGTACLPLPMVPPNPANPIRTVAVLPFVNNSNDVEAPAYVREQFTKELMRHQYVIKPLAEVDQVLKDQMGVTLGSQLDLTTPQEIGKVLGVDGVFYASLDEFNHKITGVYNVKRVRVRSKLVNCRTGATVWKNGIGVKSVLSAGTAGAAASVAGTLQDTKETGAELQPLLGETILAPWFELPKVGTVKDTGEEAGAALAAALGERILTRALKAPLPIETQATIDILLNGFYTYYDNNYRQHRLNAGQGAVPAGPGA
jgi:hypothetical protein